MNSLVDTQKAGDLDTTVSQAIDDTPPTQSTIRQFNDNYFAAQRQTLLREAICNKVFPQTRNRIASKGNMLLEHQDFSPELVQSFTNLLLSSGEYNKRQMLVDALGDSTNSIFKKTLFLEAVARNLGELWCEDDTNFIDITIAVSRMQYLVHVLGQQVPFICESANTPSVLITSIAGEQHSMMSGILGLVFATIGWRRTFEVQPGGYLDLNEPAAQAENLSRLTQYDIVCFSWSAEANYEGVVEFVRQISTLPKNSRPVLITGGHCAESRVNELLEMGVDCVCDSIYAAVNISERCMALRRAADRNDKTHQFLNHSIHTVQTDLRLHE